MSDFFDKLKQGIDKGIATIAVKSQEVVDLTKLKTHIITLQSQKNDALADLGALVYAMYSKENYDEAKVREKVAAIAGIDAEISDLETEVGKVQNTARAALGEPTEKTDT